MNPIHSERESSECIAEEIESMYRTATNNYDPVVVEKIVDGLMRDMEEDETDWTGDNDELWKNANGLD